MSQIAKAHILNCPECGAGMTLRSTSKFKHANGDDRLFYGCSRWPACKGTHGAHPSGAPLGTPATGDTKKARITAHAAFDRLWKPLGARLTRDEAYLWMQSKMGLRSDEAHIGGFNAEQCAQLIQHVEKELDHVVS